MDVLDHFRAIWQRRWQVLLASAVIAALVFAWRSSQSPVYSAKALVSVTSGRAISGEAVTEQDTLFLTRNYAELALTPPVLTDAGMRNGLRLTPAEARARVSARAARDVGFLTIAAEGPSPPTAVALAQATADALLAAIVKEQDAALQAALQPIDVEIRETESRLLGLAPNSPAEATLQARYDALVRATTERRLAPTDRLVVVSGARANQTPVSPRPVRDATLAFLVALVLNSELAVVLEALKDRLSFGEPEEGVKELTGLPVLARVPVAGEREVVEAFRTLRTNLLFMDTGRKIRTVALVSAEPNTGKTFSSLHLAATMAGMEVPVVIVDGDLRRPGLHKELKVPASPGLGELVNGLDLRAVVHPVPGSGHLHLVPGGAPLADPAAVLGTRQFGEVLEALDWAAIVVVDTPACSVFADGLAIASQCDATIFVVDPRRSRRRAVKRVVTQLRQVGANPIGIVLNRLERQERSSYYYYNYYKTDRRRDSRQREPAGRR